MKKKNLKVVIMIAVIVLCIVGYLFYSRPMTIQQRYPMLTLDKCVEITGYYEIGTQEEPTRFVIEKDSKEFEELLTQFYGKSYRRSLKDILPRGTRTHRTESDDFQWDVYFTFEDVEFSNGNSGSVMLLHFKNWYGDLDIYFDDDRYSCYTKEQETWAKKVLNVIQSGKPLEIEGISQEKAEEIALEQCKVNYDYIKTEFNSTEKRWYVEFWENMAKDVATQTVLIDTEGNVLGSLYAE